MSSASKTFALILILIITISGLSLAIVKTVFAQSTPTPSIPTFTVQLVGPPTLVNTTYSLDPNTGQIVAKIGYTNEYGAVNITIKNQFFSNLDGNTVYYNVRIKPDNANDWSNLYNANEPVFPQQTDSEYTILSINLVGSNGALIYVMAPDIPVGAKIDIQVQAMIGSIGPAPSLGSLPSELGEFYGNTSPWSNTQIVNIPANIPLSPTPAPSSSTSTPTSTSTSTATSSSSATSFWQITSAISLIVIAILLAVIIVLLLLMRKRNRLIEVKH
jgi:hypothetical protein